MPSEAANVMAVIPTWLHPLPPLPLHVDTNPFTFSVLHARQRRHGSPIHVLETEPEPFGGNHTYHSVMEGGESKQRGLQWPLPACGGAAQCFPCDRQNHLIASANHRGGLRLMSVAALSARLGLHHPSSPSSSSESGDAPLSASRSFPSGQGHPLRRMHRKCTGYLNAHSRSARTS